MPASSLLSALSPSEVSRVSKALADAQRCRILEEIAEAGELCCSEVCGRFELTQATISHHLKELVSAELISRRKDGQFAYFRFRPETMAGYVADLNRRMHLAAPRKRAATTKAK